jgi:hypothetical protein
LARRVTGAVVFSMAAGLALTAVLQFWLGSVDGTYWANSVVIALASARCR